MNSLGNSQAAAASSCAFRGRAREDGEIPFGQGNSVHFLEQAGEMKYLYEVLEQSQMPREAYMFKPDCKIFFTTSVITDETLTNGV